MKRKIEDISVIYGAVLNLNIGGTKFILGLNTILRQPNTRLAKLITSGELKVNYGDSLHENQYYFDRPPDIFPLVQDFYRDGTFNLSRVDEDKAELLHDELKYWEIELPSPPKKIKTKALRDLGETRKKVEIFLDCLVRNRMKKKRVPFVYDLYFQSTTRDLPLCLDDMSKNKQMIANPWYENYEQTNSDLARVAEKICQGSNYPVFPRTARNFMCPIKLSMKMCTNIGMLNDAMQDLYSFVDSSFYPIIKDTLKNVFPDQLIKIISNYTKNNDLSFSAKIIPDYLRVAFYIYHTTIRGYKLFDMDNEKSRIARICASQYLNKRGIKSEWRQRKILCRDAQKLASSFPFERNGDVFYAPIYKCPDCKRLEKINPAHERELNIWYLRFDWTMSSVFLT